MESGVISDSSMYECTEETSRLHKLRKIIDDHLRIELECTEETIRSHKLLMQELKSSMRTRKNIANDLRTEEPTTSNARETISRSYKAKRRTFGRKLDIGPYNIPSCRPTPDNRMPSEKAEELLQESEGVPFDQEPVTVDNQQQ